jgi:hypothetical protein
VYFSENGGMDTGGENEWHYNYIGGNTDMRGRFGIGLVSAPEGSTAAFGNSVSTVRYAHSPTNLSANSTTLYTTTTFAKETPFTLTVTYNSADNAVKVYVNGTLEIDEIMSVPMQIEGITVGFGCKFERLEIYKGIITDVG